VVALGVAHSGGVLGDHDRPARALPGSVQTSNDPPATDLTADVAGMFIGLSLGKGPSGHTVALSFLRLVRLRISASL